MNYSTENGYLVCENTKNGIIDDFKLKGKTLVNLVKSEKGGVKQTLVADGTNKNIAYNTNIALEIGKEYTFITNISKNTLEGTGNLLLANGFTTKPSIIIPRNSIGVIAKKITIGSDHIDRGYHQVAITSNITNGEITFDYYMILEGDHTQKTPEYFEGIMSCGEDVDKMEVLSSNGGNLFDGDWRSGIGLSSVTGEEKTGNDRATSNFIKVIGGEEYTTNFSVNVVCFYNKDKKFIPIEIQRKPYKAPVNACYMKLNIVESYVIGTGDINNTIVYNVKNSSNIHSTLQSDKKRLLYYNEKDQAWKKPILRKWDSIEKHSNGKWHYHKRSVETILNGTETIRMNTVGEKSIQFVFDNYPPNIAETSSISKAQLIADIIPPVSSDAIGSSTLNEDNFGIAVRIKGVKGIFITIPKSKLSAPTIDAFKQWLQANPVAVVYQLSEERVYELTPLYLDSYEGETTLLLNGGAISPYLEFSIKDSLNDIAKINNELASEIENQRVKLYENLVEKKSQVNANDSLPVLINKVRQLRNFQKFPGISEELINDRSVCTSDASVEVWQLKRTIPIEEYFYGIRISYMTVGVFGYTSKVEHVRGNKILTSNATNEQSTKITLDIMDLQVGDKILMYAQSNENYGGDRSNGGWKNLIVSYSWRPVDERLD